jgi:CBS domain-containing protein
MKVRELMTKDLSAVEAEATLEELVQTLKASGLSSLPVVDGEGRVIGFISERDVIEATLPGYFEALEGQPGRSQLARKYREIKGKPVADYMTGEVITVRGDEEALAVADLMMRRNLKIVPVVDEEGILLGVVRRIDLLKDFTEEE